MENLSFEEAIRVAAIGPLDFIKGVQWEINKTSGKKIELFQWRLNEQSFPTQVQALVYFVEHGVQIPAQLLKTLPRIPSVAIFETMNATQVISLGQVSAWRSLTWEEGRYDKIAAVLVEEINKTIESSVDDKIVTQLKSWIKEQGESPTRIIWTNAPATWKGAREFSLPSSGAPLVLGSLESTADFKLPLSGKGEWALLQKTKHGLQFRSLLPQLPVQFFGDPSQLKAGDRLKIFDFNFELSASTEWASLKSFMRRHGVNAGLHSTPAGPRTLADTIRELLEAGSSGELIVKSENRVGYISMQEGFVEEALVGPVQGLKALFRILSWPDVQSSFERYDKSFALGSSMRLGSLDFQKAYDRWKQKVASLKAVWPPYQLKIRANPAAFMQKKTWISKEFLVFIALCESERVYEVMNNCPLLDMEVVEGLVSLRKAGLMEIAG